MEQPTPRYFFHILHGQPFRDEEGEALGDPLEARRAAVRLMGEFLRDGREGFWDAGPFTLVCVDDAGRIVVSLTARETTGDETKTVLDHILGSAG